MNVSSELSHSLQQQKDGTSSGKHGVEIVLCMWDEIKTRIGSQHKCIELSVLVSSALIGSAFFSKVTDRQNFEFRPEPRWIVLLCGYALVQSIILANYVHQTARIMSIGAHLHNWGAKQTHEIRQAVDALVNTPTLTGVMADSIFRNPIEGYLQPLMIYGSIGAALGVATYLCAKAIFGGDSSLPGWTSALVFGTGAILLVVGLIHKQAFAVKRTPLMS
jgi:hypothetical protein